jgi:hypothetical protein
MKTKLAGIRVLGGAVSLGILLTMSQSALSQTNIKFTGVNATPEDAIQLYWTSTNHELYGIQYANALTTNSDGSTAWFSLYDGYPSQGTNTFIGDFGNYDVTPAIPNPKYEPMRFYRIIDERTDNDSTDNPATTIISPSNGDILSGQTTVTVFSTCANLPIVTTKLYVDGQEMDESEDGSNFVINTCEWLNGPHTLFAVATARSSLSGPSGTFPIYTSHGVSPYMHVTFSNLISGVAFNQPFFQPSFGQTQLVTADFAAECNWKLQIENFDNSNIVLTVTGSGDSMAYNWDGTGTGETNIADGEYYYLISAETNGEPLPPIGGGISGGGGGSPPLPDSFMSDISELWAVAPDSDGAVPLVIYPPGFDTNGFTIFSASLSEMSALRPSVSSLFSTMDSSGSLSPGYSGPSGQSTTAPTRPPTSPNKNAAGTFGVAYFTWTNTESVSIPKNGILPPLTGVCHLDGSGGNSMNFINDSIPEAPGLAANFIRTMTKKGWQMQYEDHDSGLNAQSMRRNDDGYGGGQLFTTAEIGLFVDHGDYGTDPDYSQGSSMSKQTYFRCANDSGDNGWLRMCQIGFGGDLKWFALLACNSLNTYSSMSSVGAIPLKTTHMVCGCATEAAVGEDIGQLWAKNMFGGLFTSPKTVANAWFQAGQTQYSYATNLTFTIVFRVASYPECLNDTLQNNTPPASPSPAPRNLTHQDQQVWPQP